MTKPNPALKQLDALVGEWTVESPQFPGARGREVFKWMEGGAFLIEYSDPGQAEFPTGIMVIGRDDSSETYIVLYYDSRGVSRVYQMQLRDSVWTMWRDAPGFAQHFEGKFSDDGNTIHARWEKSFDGAQWKHDFDLIYARVNGV